MYWKWDNQATTELSWGCENLFMHTSITAEPVADQTLECLTLQLTLSGNRPISLLLLHSHWAMQEQAVTL